MNDKMPSPDDLDLSAFEPALREEQYLAQWQAEIDARANDPLLPAPITPIVVDRPTRRRTR